LAFLPVREGPFKQASVVERCYHIRVEEYQDLHCTVRDQIRPRSLPVRHLRVQFSHRLLQEVLRGPAVFQVQLDQLHVGRGLPVPLVVTEQNLLPAWCLVSFFPVAEQMKPELNRRLLVYVSRPMKIAGHYLGTSLRACSKAMYLASLASCVGI